LLPGDKLYVPELNDTYLIFFWSLIQFTIDWIFNPLASSFNLSLPRLSSTHKIKKDESIISLSRDYGCSDADIIEANPHLRTDILRVGDVINVPKTRRNATISTFLYWSLRIFLFYYAKPLVPSSNALQADAAQFGKHFLLIIDCFF
jgi:LysM repeat protein